MKNKHFDDSEINDILRCHNYTYFMKKYAESNITFCRRYAYSDINTTEWYVLWNLMFNLSKDILIATKEPITKIVHRFRKMYNSLPEHFKLHDEIIFPNHYQIFNKTRNNKLIISRTGISDRFSGYHVDLLVLCDNIETEKSGGWTYINNLFVSALLTTNKESQIIVQNMKYLDNIFTPIKLNPYSDENVDNIKIMMLRNLKLKRILK